MSKYLLHLNPNPPYNMRRTSMPYHRMDASYGTEQDMIDAIIARLYSSGTVAEGVDIHIVDEADLPGGSVSEENDVDYFFDAWEWED